MMDTSKYAIGYYPAPGDHCKWVHKDHIEKAPQWCSVDLRDGNQSLVIPMSLEEKLEFHQVLIQGKLYLHIRNLLKPISQIIQHYQ